MSHLKIRIQEATKDAMRARDKSRVGALRLVAAELQRVEVDERIELDDHRVVVILEKMLKQRKESEGVYRDAARSDLADQEAFEIALISEFMPQALSSEEIDLIVRETIDAEGASSMKDMGKVMSSIRSKVQGRADMGDVSSRVKAALS
ncbi:MAG: GatB/YqeY domain-containing protein [Gammaproteobacteria bacterium]|nr:GatB/YqeY domain-containing protein [Gammaproteobacteria bacterium]